MEISSTTTEYDRLIARHHAMRLRRQILTPASSPLDSFPDARPGSRPGGLGPGALDAGTGGALDAGDFDAAADQRLIMGALGLVAPFADLIDHLYACMFRRRPYLRALFPDSMEFQQAHLERMFDYLVENLHRPAQLSATLAQLGRDHRKLGVRPVHYRAFEEALCEAIRHRAGSRWSAGLEDAWVRMLRFAVEAMVAGAESALTEPPYWHAVVVGHERRRPDIAVLQVRTGEPYPYRAGQYGTVEHPRLPHTWRQYSMGCAPRADNELEFHVRRTGPGGVSEALVEHTAVGDRLRLGPPRGTLMPDDDSRDLLLVAGGTGLAPMKAIVEQLVEHRPRGRRVHLFVGARARADLYDWPSLAELGGCKPWLELVPVADDAAGGRPGAGPGRRLAEAVGRAGDWSEHLVCVSGPAGLVTEVRTRLAADGLPASRIHHDPVLGRV
ncbi:globin domain-containing protein [Streptomyces sp. BE303]|uniref:globin domain-containing protein n=1 Tax=Streptomyces sp. BE303 TaxID=3002528 RepID=UPI002E78E018|nr:globin domain-containing protein [Streptomyces sp. BE303]MED7948496.1 globin domain-containing protein [Streptomyces sp. BE303]